MTDHNRRENEEGPPKKRSDQKQNAHSIHSILKSEIVRFESSSAKLLNPWSLQLRVDGMSLVCVLIGGRGAMLTKR